VPCSASIFHYVLGCEEDASHGMRVNINFGKDLKLERGANILR
jgi:hypothetical protein